MKYLDELKLRIRQLPLELQDIIWRKYWHDKYNKVIDELKSKSKDIMTKFNIRPHVYLHDHIEVGPGYYINYTDGVIWTGGFNHRIIELV